MKKQRLIVKSLNSSNKQQVRDLLRFKGFRGCFSWIDGTTLEVGSLPKDSSNLIAALEELGVSVKLEKGE